MPCAADPADIPPADDSGHPSLGGRIEGITCARKARPAILVRPHLSVTATPTLLAFVVLYATMVFSLTLSALILLSSQLRAGCWLRYRWDQYGGSCCPACVVDGALPPALHGGPSWPSLVHVRLVFLVSCEDGRAKREAGHCSGKMAGIKMRCIDDSFNMLSGVLAPACVP